MRLAPPILLASAVLLSPARAQLPLQTVRQPTIEQLKTMYLSCNDAALNGRPERHGIMRCSILYEELKQRAFAGDFDRLLEWSRAQAPRVPAFAKEGMAQR